MNKELLASVEAFLLVHQMAPRTLGKEAINDSSLVDDLRKGRELRRGTENRVRNFMEAKDRERAGAAHGAGESGLFQDDAA